MTSAQLTILNNISSETELTVDDGTTFGKALLGGNEPYAIYPSGLGREVDVIIFSDSCIKTFRESLSDPSGACVVKMSKEERELYFDFLDYQNAQLLPVPTDGGFTGSRLQALQDLNHCMYNEATCKLQSYMVQCFDTAHDWASCTECATDDVVHSSGVSYVNSIDELRDITNLTIVTVVVRDASQGGTFNYDATKVDVDDGGYIVKGWVREVGTTASILWFWPAGQELTEDMIQAAVDTNAGSVEMLPGTWDVVGEGTNFSGATFHSFGACTIIGNSTIVVQDVTLDSVDSAYDYSDAMFRTVYDTSNSGVVDNAKKVNNLTVETAVPSGALFTDTLYDDSDVVKSVPVDVGATAVTNIVKLSQADYDNIGVPDEATVYFIEEESDAT